MITPTEARHAKANYDAALAAKYEAQVDVELAGYTGVSVVIDVTDWEAGAAQAVRQLYSKAWHVDHDSGGFRGEAYLRFREYTTADR